jgi:hypothetical protein
MSPHSMKCLHKTVAVVLNTARYGGKLIPRDDSTLILKDYRCISTRLLDLIHEQFPQVDVTIQSHEDSASGFVILFVLRDNTSLFRSSAFAQAVMFAFILTLTATYDFLFATFSIAWI